MPSEKTSERLSIGLPQACSGLMYRSLPRSAPLSVVEALLAALAMPKSVSFTSPSNEMRMFCGLMSRWTISMGWPLSSFLRCAYSRAAQTLLTT